MDSKQREELADQLQALVEKHAERFAKAAESSEGSSRHVSLSEIKDFHWLSDILRPKQTARKRWPLVLIFCITALALTFLLASPSSINVLIRATTTEVAFGSNESADIYLVPSEISVNAVQFYGTLTSVPSGAMNADGTFVSSEWKNLRIEHIYVHLRPNEVPTMTLRTESPQTVLLCVEHGDLYVDVAGAKMGDASGDNEVAVHAVSGSQVANATKERAEACARWEATSRDSLTILSNLPVTDLHVSGSEAVVAGENDRTTIFPTALKSARLTFPEAPGLKYAFEGDERIGLTKFRGQVASVSLSKGFLEVRASGTADRVTRSSDQAERSVVPSRLAILRTRYSELWFAWGTLLYLIGLVTAFLKWRGVEL
jgi:hypothetical protein